MKFLRIGPNLPFTFVILLFAMLEIVFSPARSVPGIKNHLLFNGFIIGFSLFTWLTGVWLFWFLSSLLLKISNRPRIRSTMFILCGFIAWSIIAILASLWVAGSYVGKFPNLDSMRMSRTDSGVAFIFSFIEETAPTAKFFFIGFIGLTVVLVPLITIRMLKNRWPSEEIRLVSRKIAVYWWIISGGAAMCCYMYSITDADLFVRMLQGRELEAKATPVFAMAVSAADTWLSEEHVPPIVDPATLVPLRKEQSPARPTRPLKNVLYLAMESFRQDLIFQKVDGIEITPRLNELATSSQLFLNAHAQATHTDYAMPAYMTSLYPLRMTQHYFYEQFEPWPKMLIYDYLAKYGYRNAVITSDNTAWGAMRHFFWSDKLEVFFDSENMPASFTGGSTNRGYITNPKTLKVNGSNTHPDDKTVGIALSWLSYAKSKGQPWFLHTMLQQTHFPYILRADYPKPFQPCEADFAYTFFNFPEDKIHVLKNIYYNAAHAVDLEVGRYIDFLKESGQLENTIIVVVGDHGEAFNENGIQTHAGKNIEPVLKVPMMIFDPSMAGEKIEYPAEQVDMAPTVCAMLGIPPSPVFQGIDLLSSARPPLEKRNTFVSTTVPGFWHGDAIYHAGRWKYCMNNYYGTTELFDLETDPKEEHDLQEAEPELAAGLRHLLTTWRQNQLAYYKYEMFYKQYYPPRNVPSTVPTTGTAELQLASTSEP